MGFNIEKELNKQVERDNNNWKSIGRLDIDLKHKKQTPIGLKLLELKLSVIEFSNMINLSHVIVNRLTSYGSDITAVELVLSCRYLGLDYDKSYEDYYNIYNKNDTLVNYICKVKGITKTYLCRVLGVRISELEVLIKNIGEITKEQSLAIKEALGIKDKKIDLSLCVYDLFKDGKYELLDKYLIKTKLKVNKKSVKDNNSVRGINVKDINIVVDEKRNRVDDMDGIVLKCNSNNSNTKDRYIKAIHKGIIGIRNILQELDNELMEIISSNESYCLSELSKVGTKVKTNEVKVDTKVKVDEVKGKTDTKDTDNLAVGIGCGMYNIKGTYVESENKHYSAFYTIRLNKGLSLEEVSKATGLTVKDLKNLEVYDATHNNISCSKLREYYGIGNGVYLDGVTDKLRLLGYLLVEYNVNVPKYANHIGIGRSTLYKLKYKSDIGSNEVNDLINYLKESYKDVDNKVKEYKKLTKK